jgi:hypothetical protein
MKLLMKPVEMEQVIVFQAQQQKKKIQKEMMKEI